MSVRFLAALAALGLFISSAFAEKKKIDNAPETGPEPRQVVASPAANQALADSVAEQLRSSGVAKGAKVDVMVIDGAVTLAGEATCELQHDEILEALKRVPGIRRIESSLKATGPSPVVATPAREVQHLPATDSAPRAVAPSAAMTLPSPHYLEQRSPQYFPQEPDFPPAPDLSYKEEAAPLHRLVLKTYAVADLVVPLPVVGAPQAVAPKTLEAELIRNITTAVEPKCWSVAGGKCTIDYFKIGMALVVNAEPSVHEAISKFLDATRQMQDRQVVSEIRLMTVSDEWFQQSGLARECAPAKGASNPAPRFYTNSEFATMMRAAKADGQVEVITAPKLTCLNGQAGRIRSGETAHYLTGFTMNSENGKLVYVPKNEAHELGVDLTIAPTVAADNRSIKLTVNGCVREHGVLPVPTTPVTMLLQPTPESGKHAEMAPFTHLLQEPRIITRTVADTVVVPDGGTVLLYGGKASIQTTAKETVPMMKDIPFLEALFVAEKKQTTTNHLLVVVSSRIIRESELEECVQCTAGSGKLPKLLHEYGRACKEGRIDEARRLAIECLAIDPTCFAKN
ncbi:MAG TPA: BON domain-containing protein [Gemmataceae bacterium]|jgi:hypothetical protein|nr:BON domain-containing protein [Gemmataceae bacterium]